MSSFIRTLLNRLPQSPKALLLIAAVAFVLVRWLAVVYNEAYAFNVAEEEMIYSTLAAERLRGNELVDDMLYQEYTTGGFWLQTHLYKPLIKLGGCSRYAMKWLPIGFSLIAFLFYLLLADRWLGRRAAVIFALLFTLGDPLLLQHQIVGYANHNELHVFFAPILLLTFYLLFTREPLLWPALATAFGVGLLTTSAIFYSYSAMVFALFLLLLSPFILARLIRQLGVKAWATLPVAALGLLLGSLPAWWLRLTIAHKAFGVYHTETGSGAFFLSSLIEGLRFLFGGAWLLFPSGIAPHMFCFDESALNVFLFLVFSVCLLAALALGFRCLLHRGDGQTPIAAALLALPVLFYLLAFAWNWRDAAWTPYDDSASSALLHYHQMVVFLPFVYLTVAGVLAAGLAAVRKGARAITWATLIVLLVLGLHSLGTVTVYPARQFVHEQCTNYKVLTQKNIVAIEYNLPPGQVCEAVNRYAISYDPVHAEEICAVIRSETDCLCPFD